MTGSRLLWEIRNWRYPDPRPGQAQRQDPDDDTADGADLIAALRYAIMGSLRAAKKYEPDRPRSPHFDYQYDELMERLNRAERVARGGLKFHHPRSVAW